MLGPQAYDDYAKHARLMTSIHAMPKDAAPQAGTSILEDGRYIYPWRTCQRNEMRARCGQQMQHILASLPFRREGDRRKEGAHEEDNQEPKAPVSHHSNARGDPHGEVEQGLSTCGVYIDRLAATYIRTVTTNRSQPVSRIIQSAAIKESQINASSFHSYVWTAKVSLRQKLYRYHKPLWFPALYSGLWLAAGIGSWMYARPPLP
jgi:hypothetical protein